MKTGLTAITTSGNMKQIEDKLTESLYLKVLAFFLTFTWLLPNHYPPWGAFHNDAYAAGLLLLTAVVIFFLAKPQKITWHFQTLVVVACACVPLFQASAGLINWWGTAWVNSAYLIGLACAMTLGAFWEKFAPESCGDFLFAGLAIAGVISTFIGWSQWLDLNVSDYWVLRTNSRPYANLSQPNQTATLYVLAILGCAWFHYRKAFGKPLLTFLVAILLIGLALTGSRTGWINATVLSASFFCWFIRGPRKYQALGAVVGLLFLILVINTLPLLSEWLGISRPVDWASRTVLNSRDFIWPLAWDAAIKQPITGYGWGQTAAATLSASLDHTQLDAVTDHSHNLFLDLMIWNGVILGSLLCVALLSWAFWLAKKVKTSGQLIVALGLLVLGLHAMSEFPLNYAYFLLPAGLLAGILAQQLHMNSTITTSAKPLIALFLIAGFALFGIVRDYVRIEPAFTAIRFESAGVRHNLPRTPPDVWVLTNLREVIVMARWQPEKGMQAQELESMDKVASTYPSTNNIYKIALAYGLNNNKEKATYWLKVGCKTAPTHVCKLIQNKWSQDERLADLAWPVLE